MRNALRIAVLSILCLAARAAGAAVIFSDNFDDGDVSDWIKTTNVPGTTSVAASASDYVSSPFSLTAYLEPTQVVFDAFVRATHDFHVPTSGTYTLELAARSSLCSGCTISYDVLVDNELLQRQYALSFQLLSFSLPGLAAGSHQLTLGMHTTLAGSGPFYAQFDDVRISQVPAPGVLALTGAALAALAIVRRR